VKQTDCDVLVIGGGVAGVMAAVAASRSGARTLLVEQEAFLGGAGYAGMFRNLCGLYLNGDTVPAETLNAGLVREVVHLLHRSAPQRKVTKMGQVYVLPYEREDLLSVLLSLCNAEKKLTLFRNAAAIDVKTEQGTVRSVGLVSQQERSSVQAGMVIDCSGDGAVAALAGASFEVCSGESLQLAGYTLHIKGLENADELLSIKVPYHLARAADSGTLARSLRFTTFTLGDDPEEGFLKLSIDAAALPDRDEKAKADAVATHRYLAGVLPAFKNSSIAASSPKVLDREGRRVVGGYTLTEEDVLSAKKFSDGVVKNAWPVELWDRNKGTIYKYVPRGEYYEIPLRCLTVRGTTNLLTAGRCISVTHEALGSTRVMGACMALGEQAGRAAAYRVKHGKYPENVKEYED
jgi:glycine/D-amino acid oxidase-like deaminating enzyme